MAKSHGRARVFRALGIGVGALALLYGALVLLGGRAAIENLPLAYDATTVVLLEGCLQAGILPCARDFDELFSKLPFDLKILTPDTDALFRTLHRTDAALPLLAADAL